jgi:SSS family solute:Na+ symporter
MRAVAYTDALQTILLVIGSGLLTIFGLKALGGWGALRHALDPDMFNLWKPLVPAGMEGTWAAVKEPTRIAWYFNTNYPWLGMLFCAPIIGLWYWTTDQYIVQRALGARDEREARRGSIFAAFLKLLPVFIFIIPGMIALALAKTGRAPGLAEMVGPDGRVVPGVAQAAFPLMVMQVLPAGVRTHEHREFVPILENDQDMTRLASRVSAVLRRHSDAHALLLRRHGLYTWGDTLDDAERHVEIAEFLFEVLGHGST